MPECPMRKEQNTTRSAVQPAQKRRHYIGSILVMQNVRFLLGMADNYLYKENRSDGIDIHKKHVVNREDDLHVTKAYGTEKPKPLSNLPTDVCLMKMVAMFQTNLTICRGIREREKLTTWLHSCSGNLLSPLISKDSPRLPRVSVFPMVQRLQDLATFSRHLLSQV